MSKFKRFFLLIIFIHIYLFADSMNVDVVAENIKTEGDKVYASGSVVVTSGGYFLTTDRAVYDKANNILELFGDINIFNGVSYVSRGNYAKLDISNKSYLLKPFVGLDYETQIWVDCSELTLSNGSYEIRDGYLSTCNIDNPDWKIGFKKSKYDSKSKILEVNDMFFYAGDIPILYFPYFWFPIGDNKRKSGLLVPSFNISSSEGFVYLQPIYFAFEDWYDIELIPQIRTSRGYGGYGIFRFVRKDSKGKLTFGGFVENKSYYEENNLAKKEHYGVEFKYQKDNVLSDILKKDFKDGLYLNIKYFSDIDYFNLQKSNSDTNDIFDTIWQESNIRYFAKDDKNYFGIYSNYYIDTNTTSNSKTVQNIPTLHYSRFTQSILSDRLLYSVDYKFNNYFNEDNISAIENSISVPLSTSFDFLDKYLTLTIGNNLDASYLSYLNPYAGSEYNTFFQSTVYARLASYIAKPYSKFLHNALISLEYSNPVANIVDKDLPDFIYRYLERHRFNFYLSEYFYTNSGFNTVSHTLNQAYYLDNGAEEIGNLENDITVNFTNSLSISNKIVHSWELAKLLKFQTSLDYDFKEYTAGLTYTYEDGYYDERLINPTISYTNSISASFIGRVYKSYSIIGNVEYDIEGGYAKSWEAGWDFEKDCWGYRLTVRETIEPQLTSQGSSARRDLGVYFTFRFANFGSYTYGFVN